MAKRRAAPAAPKTKTTTQRASSKRQPPKAQAPRLVALSPKEVERNVGELLKQHPPYAKDRWLKATHRLEA